MEIEMLADYACLVGEGPLYHPQEKAVYWTDIDTGRLFRLDTKTLAHEIVFTGEKVGGFTIQTDGALLLFMDRGAIKVFQNGVLVRTVREDIPEERESRFNDVIADAQGRVFCGTMPTRQRNGHLYRLDTDGTLTKILEDIGCSNGMGFTEDRKIFYYTDSGPREIYRFMYDEATGEIHKRETLITTPEGDGVPDGMTVDADGNIWTAKWGGGGVDCYSPDGTFLYKLELPVRIVSCVTFGGDDYADMYITTAGGDQKEKNGAASGALFRVRGVTLNGKPVRGFPEYFSRIGL